MKILFNKVAITLLLSAVLGSTPMLAQVLGGVALPSGSQTDAPPNPLSDTSVSPSKALLFQLEATFAKDTAQGGGAAFAKWFADDAVTIANGQQPVRGRDAIARSANWSPSAYQLTWTPTDAVMSPAGDMGYTWGHYEGRSKDADGNAKVTAGRYFTIWRKEPDGSWKVVLDASNQEPPDAGDCCRIPTTP